MQVVAVFPQQVAQFGQLAGIAAGEHQLHADAFGWIRSQRLPWMSRNTATVPYSSWRGASSKTAPAPDSRAWPRAKSDRKSAVSGKRVSVGVDLGGRRIIKKKNYYHHYPPS